LGSDVELAQVSCCLRLISPPAQRFRRSENACEKNRQERLFLGDIGKHRKSRFVDLRFLGSHDTRLREGARMSEDEHSQAGKWGNKQAGRRNRGSPCRLDTREPSDVDGVARETDTDPDEGRDGDQQYSAQQGLRSEAAAELIHVRYYISARAARR
jgi:hypothetical protein